MLKALIFDFDGLILDTETPEYLVWQALYQEQGFELPPEKWGQIVGGYGLSDFDAAEHLAQLSQGRLESAALRHRHRTESSARIAAQAVLPGVVGLIRTARQRDLKLAIASSSPHTWVDEHASRLGLLSDFDEVICAEDVNPGRTKPHPDLFLTALERLQVRPREAVVFEDSPNGVQAAQRAGIFVVAVPNELTARLDLQQASLSVGSLADVSLDDLEQRLARL